MTDETESHPVYGQSPANDETSDNNASAADTSRPFVEPSKILKPKLRLASIANPDGAKDV